MIFYQLLLFFYDSSIKWCFHPIRGGDGVEILVSFWFKNWDHMSWMYGEGLSDRIRRVVSNFLAILSCDFFILLDLLFGILCDISHSLNRSKLYNPINEKSKNPKIQKSTDSQAFSQDFNFFFFQFSKSND